MLRRPFPSSISPWHEMERMRREMNRLFYGAPRRSARAAYPAMNVWANDDGAIITAELPGIDPAELDIAVTGDTLTLEGNRPHEEVAEDTVYHRRERAFGTFSRVFQLPFQVDPALVEASYQKGILHITLPRAEQDKPRKIAIQSS
ncbi:MAG: Hsp20/alpha crystallin family protein [Anaerolineae bacterium]|nr:Hsp20/alpha crystallin family protein [Anaerolineae bacterium]